MKKINLKGISEILSERELKNVLGGSDSQKCSSGACDKITMCYYGSTEGYCKYSDGSCTCQ